MVANQRREVKSLPGVDCLKESWLLIALHRSTHKISMAPSQDSYHRTSSSTVGSPREFTCTQRLHKWLEHLSYIESQGSLDVFSNTHTGSSEE